MSVKLLLDTHVLLWWLADSSDLTDDVKRRIDTESEVFVSAATVWEIAIKQALGKLKVPDDYLTVVKQSGLRGLPIDFEHSRTAGALPAIHADPFDRMLVAQAHCEGLVLVTRDPNVLKYDVRSLAA